MKFYAGSDAINDSYLHTERDKCVYYNRTVNKIITSAYEGIPETFLLNILGWLILILLFAVLRKRAWNYGRIALVQKTEEKKWIEEIEANCFTTDGAVVLCKLCNTEVSYDKKYRFVQHCKTIKHKREKAAGNKSAQVQEFLKSSFNRQTEQQAASSKKNRGADQDMTIVKRWTQLFYGTMDEVVGASEVESVTSLDSSIHIDKGFCSWLTAIFRIKDENILMKCGPDAVQYLSFQRHIIVYMLIMMVISLTIVLPINFQGELEGDERTFGHTTVSNLDPSSSYLWTHVTLAILYLPLGIIIMRRFSVTIKFDDRDTSVSRTLMITKIPSQNCDSADLHRHFREAYPEMEIQDIQLAYDISKVSVLDKEREKVYQARLYCENYLKTTGMRLDMRPYACGNICGCCDLFGCPTVDAIEYYAEEEARLRNQVDQERTSALKKPVGIAFVTLLSVEAARKVYDDHRPTCKCSNNPPCSSVSRQLEPHNWQVKFAPSPKDIYWENLSVPSNYWYIKAVLVNFFLFLVLFFLTTPVIVVNFLDTMTVENELEKMSPVLSEFLPTLLLWTVAALLPVLVSYSDQWLSHWTRSEQNHSIMHKTFIFLLFMVLILPSLGLTSAQAFVDWTIHARNETYRWECLFLPDKGAFFVNYVTTSALIGTALELIRFPELFVYTVRLSLARSQAETASVRKAILWEFPFGVQYAWMLLIFAMTTTYSLSCPLITPFGLLYMVLKHFVDRYNIYFAYGPSKISSRIHATAINIVIVSITLQQLSFTSLSILRRGLNDISIYSLIGFIITLLFLSAQIFLNWFKGFSPISYQNYRSSPGSSNQASPRRDGSMHQFVPYVLQPSPTHPDVVSVQSPVEGLSILQRTYGTRAGNSADMVEAMVSPDSVLSLDPGSINTHDRIALYQNYDGSNTEV